VATRRFRPHAWRITAIEEPLVYFADLIDYEARYGETSR